MFDHIPSELLAGLFVGIVAALFAIGIVIGDARHARQIRKEQETVDNLKRDVHTAERRRMLAELQRRTRRAS